VDLEPLWRILIAAGLTVPVGLEREIRGKAAGLRTHVVVSIASAALGYVSITAAGGEAGNDATRIAAQVVTGIGFMGAGVIFASGGRVHGLTTAAALWSAMAIGLCVGLGSYGIATALVVVTVAFLGPVEVVVDRLTSRFAYDERTFQFVAADLDTVRRAQDRLAEMRIQTRHMKLSSLDDGIDVRVLARCKQNQMADLYSALRDVEGVRFISFEALADGYE
jgi:putative Mg2+ transporter-C (MgtC) family protein